MLVHTTPSDADVIAAIGDGPTTELSKIYLLPRQHGSGLASELMDAAVARPSRTAHPRSGSA